LHDGAKRARKEFSVSFFFLTVPMNEQQQRDEQEGRIDYSRADRGLYTFRVYDKPDPHHKVDSQRRNPSSMRESRIANRSLSREELRDHLNEIRGLPVIYEHRRGTGIAGKVVRVAQGPDGTVDAQCRLFSDTPDGRSAIWRLETNRGGRGASLSHYFDNGRVRPQELSACAKGERDGTGFIEYVPEPSDIGMDGARGVFEDDITLSRWVKTNAYLPRLGPIRPWNPAQSHVMASNKDNTVIVVPFGDVRNAHMTRRRIKFAYPLEQGFFPVCFR
jgi:hypothetical protein